MKYICVTEIDAATKTLCTVEPMRTGPSFPEIKGLNLDWADKSTWPVACTQAGVYQRAPKYYATCDDDADITVNGVLESLPEQEWMQRKHDEFYARRPFESWIWDETTFVWSSPVAYPQDGKTYKWDEAQQNWVEVSTI